MPHEELITVIGSGVYVEGNITVLSSMDIEGTLKGNITVAGDLTLGPQARIDGDVITRNADILGKINGNLVAVDTVTLHPGSVLNGDLYSAKVNFAEGSSFNGKCTMIKRKELRVDKKTKQVELVDLSPEDLLTKS